jgi:uncharacterized small protein (DUF1192 family)
MDPEQVTELETDEPPELEDHRVEKAGVGWWTKSRSPVYGIVAALVVVFFITSLAVPTLLRSRQAARGSYPAPAPTVVQEQSVPAEPQRAAMVVRAVKLTLITPDFAAARAGIDTIVRRYQGYLDRLNVRADTGSARGLSATLRLPAGQVDTGLNDLKQLGRLMDESQNISDITGQYVDLAARLSNARNSEQRLLELMRERAGNLKDVVEMEREISSVREQIERMEAQRKDLNNKEQFATIQLELAEEYHAQPGPPPPSTAAQVQSAAVEGVQSAAENAVEITLFVLRYGPAFIIWLAALGPLCFILRRLHGRIRNSAN